MSCNKSNIRLSIVYKRHKTFSREREKRLKGGTCSNGTLWRPLTIAAVVLNTDHSTLKSKKQILQYFNFKSCIESCKWEVHFITKVLESKPPFIYKCWITKKKILKSLQGNRKCQVKVLPVYQWFSPLVIFLEFYSRHPWDQILFSDLTHCKSQI